MAFRRAAPANTRGLQGTFVLSGVILPTTDENIIQIVGRKEGRYALNQCQVMVPMQPTPQGQAPSASNGSGSQQAANRPAQLVARHRACVIRMVQQEDTPIEGPSQPYAKPDRDAFARSQRPISSSTNAYT
jgi:hypothetical protein